MRSARLLLFSSKRLRERERLLRETAAAAVTPVVATPDDDDGCHVMILADEHSLCLSSTRVPLIAWPWLLSFKGTQVSQQYIHMQRQAATAAVTHEP